MHNRRALLYMPGDEIHKIQKVTTITVDCACMDLEDAVVFDRKEAARQTVVQALQNFDFGKTERLVRINSMSSGLAEADLEAVLPAHPDGIVLPKLRDPQELVELDQRLEAFEKQSGGMIGRISILAIIETARAVIQLEKICAASRR
jgi:citrate lyase subunit beta-like protein